MEKIKLEIKNIVKFINSKKILDISNCRFEEGNIYSLYGPNGAGKTTLLHILAFLEEPSSGEFFFDGRKIETLALSRKDLIKEITLVQQNPYLFNTTVAKNISYGLKLRGIDKGEIKKVVRESLDMVGLSGFEKRKAK